MMKPVVFVDGSEEMGDEDIHTFVTEHSVKKYEHYMDYTIESPSKTRQLCTLLRGIGSKDIIMLRINSDGGRFDLAMEIINAINDCEGTVYGIIEQGCASAATMIFLSCHNWHVHPYAEMMIHSASYGVVGKSHEVVARVFAAQDRIEKAVRCFYKGFLAEEEIELVLNGGDIYLTSEEIFSRLETVAEMRNKQLEGVDNANEEETD